MKIIGNPKPWIGNDLGTGGTPEPEPCDHEPGVWQFDEEHHAFLVARCERCGAELLATGIDTELLEETGEISVTEWIDES